MGQQRRSPKVILPIARNDNPSQNHKVVSALPEGATHFATHRVRGGVQGLNVFTAFLIHDY